MFASAGVAADCSVSAADCSVSVADCSVSAGDAADCSVSAGDAADCSVSAADCSVSAADCPVSAGDCSFILSGIRGRTQRTLIPKYTHTVCVPYYKAAPYNISHTKKFSRAKYNRVI